MSKTPGTRKWKIIFASALLLAAGGAGYGFRGELTSLARFLRLTPCAPPITYKVGAFDERFGISEDRFAQAIADAARLWNEAAGRPLFRYDDDGEMPVNLWYDERQQATDQLRKLDIAVDDTLASYKDLENRYEKFKAAYEARRAQYAQDVQRFEAAQRAYEQEVRSANKRVGVSPAAYERLEAERARVNETADRLNAEAAALNEQVDTINAFVATLNRIGSQLNQDVSTYNTAGERLGEFEEGTYTANAFRQKIDIYQFDSYRLLVQVLTHEFGHALGLGHVDDPNAIMYRLNQSKNSALTPADVAELKRVCRL